MSLKSGKVLLYKTINEFTKIVYGLCDSIWNSYYLMVFGIILSLGSYEGSITTWTIIGNYIVLLAIIVLAVHIFWFNKPEEDTEKSSYYKPEWLHKKILKPKAYILPLILCLLTWFLWHFVNKTLDPTAFWSLNIASIFFGILSLIALSRIPISLYYLTLNFLKKK